MIKEYFPFPLFLEVRSPLATVGSVPLTVSLVTTSSGKRLTIGWNLFRTGIIIDTSISGEIWSI